MQELLPHTDTRSTEMAELINSNEVLQDPATRRDFFASLDSSDFVDMVEQVGAVLRTGDSSQRQHLDGDTTYLQTHEVPAQEDKEQLLKETWDTAKSFLANPDMADEDAVSYAALTVAGGILYIHPFQDGNGRVSRVLSYAIEMGARDDLEGKLDNMLGHNAGGGRSWAVTPSYDMIRMINRGEPYMTPKDLPLSISWEENEETAIADYLPGAGYNVVEEIAHSNYRGRILGAFYDLTDNHAREVIKAHIEYDADGNPQSLRADQALDMLVQDPDNGLTYAAQLKEAKHWMQAEYVRAFLKAMQSNEPQELPRDAKRRIEALSTREALTNSEKAYLVVFGKYVDADGKILPRDLFRAEHEASTDSLSTLKSRQSLQQTA